MDSEHVLVSKQQDKSLCYKCKRITADTVIALGGFQHSDQLEDVINSASECEMCALMCEGLSADIEDKLGNDPEESHRWISIRPDICHVRLPNGHETRQPSLRVWSISSRATCMLNLYLPKHATLSSPLRPKGSQKLYFARLWLRESQQHGRLLTSPTAKLLESVNDENESKSSCVPTRILDLGELSHDRFGDIRLASYQPGQDYFALSHRWGTAQHLVTTRRNYLNHLLSIRFRQLPKTFQDAITVTRYMGVRYLWIDALCILQDDKIDWHREALLMGTVYREATCTLAIHDASDDSEGFLEASLRPPKTVSLGSIPNGTNLTVCLRSNFRAEVENSKLSRRGWVLQERFLSLRTIHFTKTSMFLEDGRGVISEDDVMRPKPLSAPMLQAPDLADTTLAYGELWKTATRKPDSGEVATAIPFAIGRGVAWKNEVGNGGAQLRRSWPLRVSCTPYIIDNRSFNFHAWILGSDRRLSAEASNPRWFRLLEKYSRTELTFESDKLPAIVGLVQSVKTITGGSFLNGLWSGNYYIGLLWAASRSSLRRPMLQRAPSWSWLSMNGAIQHPQSLKRGCSSSTFDHKDSNSPMKGEELFVTQSTLNLLAKIRYVHHLEPALPSEVPLFFRRSSHIYKIVGRQDRKPLIWFTPEKIEEERRRRKSGLGVIGFAVLDEGALYADADQISCVQIALRDGSEETWVLLVVPSPTLPDHYWRIGMGCLHEVPYQLPCFHKVVERPIALI